MYVCMDVWMYLCMYVCCVHAYSMHLDIHMYTLSEENARDGTTRLRVKIRLNSPPSSLALKGLYATHWEGTHEVKPGDDD